MIFSGERIADLKKIIITMFLAALLLPALASCAKPPELGEIRDRVEGLIEASHEINVIFYGEGLPTYPRVTSVYDQTLTYSEKYDVYYYVFDDSVQGKLVMYFDKDTNNYKFARIVEAADVKESDGTPILHDEESGVYLFATEYTEAKPEYVYNEKDIEGYNVVRTDAKYVSIDEIKSAAEEVYSAEYLKGVYEAAFTGLSSGSVSSGGVIGARFIEQEYLLRQSASAKNYITAKRIYDYSTMKIVRPSNDKIVNITIDSHLEGSDEILNVRLTLVLQDGQWYLDTPTY